MRNASVIVEEDSQINKVIIRIPPFWPEEPELWSAHMESQFELCKAASDHEKYIHSLARAPASEGIYVIINLPNTGNYQTLKKALIQRLTKKSGSQEHCIRQLLEMEEIGDRKPSQFLRHLSTLVGRSSFCCPFC